MHARTFSALLNVAALVAIGAVSNGIAADDLKSVRYVCPDGERFSVEYKASHARLRNSTGVFSLSADGGTDGHRYSDGNLILSPHDGGATLQRTGQTVPYDCQSEPRRS